MKVLLICNDFPPLNSIGAQRPYSWFRHLPEEGIQITVITKNWAENAGHPEDILRERGTGTLRTFEENRTLIRVPVENILPDRLFIKYGNSRFRLFRKSLTFLYKMLSFPCFRFDRHRLLYREAFSWLRQNSDTEYIITTGEPFILHKYGYLLTKKTGIKWVADYRDGWYHNHVHIKENGLFSRFLRTYERIFEKKYLRKARLITTVDTDLAGKLRNMHGKTPGIIYNGFEKFFTPEDISQSLPLLLTHSGTLYPGQRTEFLLESVRQLDEAGLIKEGELEVRFLGLEYFPDQCERILSYSKGLAKYIRTTPRVSGDKALRVSACSDLLVVFTVKDQPIIPAKVYDYIAAQRPVLVLPGDGSLLDSLIMELKSGYVFYSIEDFKTSLLKWIQEKRTAKGPIPKTLTDKEKALFYTLRAPQDKSRP
jgi:hypothetical protein